MQFVMHSVTFSIERTSFSIVNSIFEAINFIRNLCLIPYELCRAITLTTESKKKGKRQKSSFSWNRNRWKFSSIVQRLLSGFVMFNGLLITLVSRLLPYEREISIGCYTSRIYFASANGKKKSLRFFFVFKDSLILSFI